MENKLADLLKVVTQGALEHLPGHRKVLVSRDEKGQEVHLILGDFLDSRETVCGERLHAINTVHIRNDKISVTCTKCLVYVQNP